MFKISHMVSPLKYLAPVANDIVTAMKVFGIRDFLPNNWVGIHQPYTTFKREKI